MIFQQAIEGCDADAVQCMYESFKHQEDAAKDDDPDLEDNEEVAAEDDASPLVDSEASIGAGGDESDDGHDESDGGPSSSGSDGESEPPSPKTTQTPIVAPTAKSGACAT